jgi:hypothetical protein
MELTTRRAQDVAVLDSAWPMTLQDRVYVGRRALDGGWRLVIGEQVVHASDARLAARALLSDAFAGHRVRDDLVDAFAAWLPRCGFRLSGEFVAAWGLHWALAL